MVIDDCDAWRSERSDNEAQADFHSEAERRDWLALVRFAMASGASKEQFRAFLESELAKRNSCVASDF